MIRSENEPPREITATEEEEYPPPTGEKNKEHLISSEPMSWYPFAVIREDRRKATVVWVSLLAAFFAYIAYIIWDAFESRKNPGSSIEMKQEYFEFPDMAFCVSFLQGCLTYGGHCFNDSDTPPWITIGYNGFLGDPSDLVPDEASLAVAEEYPGCSVIPLSKLEVNETAIKNGDINYFGALFYFLWIEDPWGTYTQSEYWPNTQFVNVYFIDLDNSVESIGKEVVDVKLPYERMEPTYNASFVAKQNHMVLSMTEFVGIAPSSGMQQKPNRTYSQSTTSGTQNWWWTGDSYPDTLYSFLSVDITIGKFEYTKIVEIDPVDGWAIIGAIGGVWQFVVLGFGLFFVYAEKQRPDMKKFRDIKKTVSKSASMITHRLSSVSSKSSRQDIEVDASNEDLPEDWVKKQRKNKSFYYFNVITGASQDRSPREGLDANTVNVASVPPPRQGRIAKIFQIDRHGQEAERLPPGWVVRIDDQGQTYYLNTILKTTQWERPTQRVPSNRCIGVQAIDGPAMQSCESFPVPPNYPNESKQEEKTEAFAKSVHSPLTSGTASSAPAKVDASLPSDWHRRVTQDGKILDVSSQLTKMLQGVGPRRQQQSG